MGLKAHQGIVIYSPDIYQGEKLQALIKQITPEFIIITIPINNIVINAGIEIFINFWDDNATYEFKTKTLSSKSAAEDSINIEKPSTLTKVINRGFPRITVKTPGSISDAFGFHAQQCLIIDISGGGVLIASKINKKISESVRLAYMLPDGEDYDGINGIIVWKKEMNNELFNYGIEFDKLSDIRRQKIIAFVNNQLIKQKTK